MTWIGKVHVQKLLQTLADPETPITHKRGELAANRKEEQELAMLALNILQSSLGFINTLMIQDTLALPNWADVLTDADRRV